MPSHSTPLTARRPHFLRLAVLALTALGVFVGATGTAGAQASLRLTPLSAAAVARARAASGSAAPGRAPTARAAASTQFLDPGQIRSAYALPAVGARGQKIAIISAYDDPYAQSDLNAYTQQYGIPACTPASGCFEKLNQSGKTSPLPPTDVTGGTWITESAVGTEIARGVCESCSIMLVEANSTGRADLSAAVNTAANAGATVIVTSFTLGEDQVFDPLYLPDYAHARAAVVSAVGDAQNSAYGYTGEANFPASLPDVLAVGGTQLSRGRDGAYGSEQAWAGTVSGCSLYQAAPSWQAKDATAVGCQSRRAVADVAAMAEPGAAVHITGTGVPGGPWYAATGTSLSAPIIGATIGLAGSMGSREAQVLYSRAKSDPAAFHDIRAGADSSPCTFGSICQAATGYDGPTGLGTPLGLAAFLPSGGALNPHHAAITLKVSRRGLQVRSGWGTSLTIANGNAFAVTGQVTLQRTMRVGGRLRKVVFASGKLDLGPLASAGEKLTIAKGERTLLKQLGSVPVYVRVHARGPAGSYATVTRSVQLRAP